MQTAEQITETYTASPGQEFQVDGRFAVASCTVKEGKSGKFAVVELRDPTGSITARCFDEGGVTSLPTIGAIDARLRVSQFNGSMSAVVQRFSKAELELAEILRYAGLDVAAHERRVARIREWMEQCNGTVYGDVIREVFRGEGVWDSFTMAPAAVRLHHAEPGGLVRHLVEVGEGGLGLLESIEMSYDRPYFLAGVLLHDIGKLDTYTLPPTIQYSAQGQLVEHQIYSTVRVAKACAAVQVPASVEAKLIHIIEQAHGAYRHAEWQDPLGPEVKALAAADFFSSRLGSTEREQRSQEALDRLIAEDSRTAVGSHDPEIPLF